MITHLGFYLLFLVKEGLMNMLSVTVAVVFVVREVYLFMESSHVGTLSYRSSYYFVDIAKMVFTSKIQEYKF